MQKKAHTDVNQVMSLSQSLQRKVAFSRGEGVDHSGRLSSSRFPILISAKPFSPLWKVRFLAWLCGLKSRTLCFGMMRWLVKLRPSTAGA